MNNPCSVWARMIMSAGVRSSGTRAAGIGTPSKIPFCPLALLVGVLGLSSVGEAQVTYTDTDISGNIWQTTYTVTNSLSSTNLSEFTVFFPVGQYSNLSSSSSPSTWSPLVAQPDANLPAAGFYDALALNQGLGSGKSQGGFSVEYTYNGKGSPGPQTFNFVNPSTFATLASGFTSPAGGAIKAPEIDASTAASGLTLLIGSLCVLLGRRSYGN